MGTIFNSSTLNPDKLALFPRCMLGALKPVTLSFVTWIFFAIYNSKEARLDAYILKNMCFGEKQSFEKRRVKDIITLQ